MCHCRGTSRGESCGPGRGPKTPIARLRGPLGADAFQAWCGRVSQTGPMLLTGAHRLWLKRPDARKNVHTRTNHNAIGACVFETEFQNIGRKAAACAVHQQSSACATTYTFLELYVHAGTREHAQCAFRDVHENVFDTSEMRSLKDIIVRKTLRDCSSCRRCPVLSAERVRTVFSRAVQSSACASHPRSCGQEHSRINDSAIEKQEQ